MIRNLVVLSVFLTLISCKEEDNTLYIGKNDFKEVIQLKSKKIEWIGQLNPSTLKIVDSLLIVTDYLENPRIHFYNKNSHDKVSQYGNIGEGPEEYFSPELNGNIFHKSETSDVFIRIFEFGYGLMHEVNLTAILAEKSLTKTNKYYFNPEILNADNIFVLGNELYGETTDNRNVKYFKTSLDDMSNYEKIGVINSDDILDKVPIEDRVNFDRSFMDYSVDNDRFVAGYLRYNKINILNRNFDEVITIIYGSQKEGPTNTRLMSKDNIFYYRKPYCGKQYIYMPYIGEKYGVKNYSEEIQVYDYKGNPVRKYLLDAPLMDFTIDEETGTLYAITGLEEDAYVMYDLN